MKKTILYTILVVIASNSASSSAMAFWGFGGDKETCHEKTHGRHSKGDKRGAHNIFGELDINSDKKITQKEFLDHSKKRFSDIDRNNDKKITKDELKKHHIEMKRHHKRGRKDRK